MVPGSRSLCRHVELSTAGALGTKAAVGAGVRVGVGMCAGVLVGVAVAMSAGCTICAAAVAIATATTVVARISGLCATRQPPIRKPSSAKAMSMRSLLELKAIGGLDNALLVIGNVLLQITEYLLPLVATHDGLQLVFLTFPRDEPEQNLWCIAIERVPRIL
jgi:hypothetical protein